LDTRKDLPVTIITLLTLKLRAEIKRERKRKNKTLL
jgi:hypothetical protein